MRINTLVAAIALLPAFGMAQFDFGGGETTNKPWTEFKLNPKTRITLNFRNANVDAIIGMISKTSGITIVKDPALTGPLTVTSAKPVSLNDAFQILSSTLSLKNYDMKKEGNLLVIKSRGNGRNGGGTPTFDPSIFNGGNRTETALKVYYITYANASQVARVINEVFASSSAPQINFGNFAGGGGGGNQRGGNQRNRPNFSNLFGQTPTVKASSDDFSNSVIVNAPNNLQNQVEDLIKKLDKQTEQPQQAKVYKLEFASASELAPTVQNVLTSNAPKGRGGISSQNVPIEQRFQQAFRFGSSSAAFGTVVADERTNSLVVTATDENQKLVQKVIDELDTEVKVENTTFVFPLSNARATEIATLLQQAFGTRTGANGTFNRNTNNNNRNTNNRNTNNRNNNNNRNNGGGGLQGNNEIDDKSIQLAMEDPNSDSGELMTNIEVAQGGGFGQIFGGGGQRRTGTGAGTNQTARDANGRLINVRDLQNQITIIPDPNTNSLIVVTNPENVQLLQSILDQLDKIPEQVMIETMIIEATLDSSSQFGVEWKYAQGRAFGTNAQGDLGSNFGNQTANPSLQGFRYSLAGGDLGVFINALKTDTKFQVLSTPRIFTSNNQEAEINISQSVPYVLSTREDTNGSQTFNYTFTDVGIVLTVTPHISANGTVTMEVNQTANDLQGFTDFNAPIINRREADTVVSVQDGESIILGGIIRSNVTSTVKKIPLLGDIPILGQLFRSTSKGNVKTELMVFLTPHIVRNPEDARKMREDTTRKLTQQSQQNIKKSQEPVPPIKDGKGKGGGNK